MPTLIMFWVRLPTLIFSVVALVIWWMWVRRSKRVANSYIAPIVLWLINLIIYQFVRLYIPSVAGDALSYWGAGINLQAVLTLAGVGYILLRETYHHE